MTDSLADLPLRGIRLPPSVSWWPPAPGWWAALALLLACIGVVVYVRRRRRKTALRDAALRELESLRQSYCEDGDTTALAGGLSLLLRRACLSRYPRAEVAGLTGEHWLRFLDRSLEAMNASVRNAKKSSRIERAPFAQGVGRALLTAPYCSDSQFDCDALCELCRVWLRGLARPLAEDRK